MSETQLNLYEKLQKIRKMAEVAQKDADGYGYKYATITNILAKVTAGMNKYGVLLIPRLEPDTQFVIRDEIRKLKTRKDGSQYEEVTFEFRAESQITYRWINVDNPEEYIDVPWFITGAQKDPSQAMGSALTYAERYFLTQFFQIATPEDDPDNWRSKQKEAEDSEKAEVAKVIVDELHKYVLAYLEEKPDDKDALSDLIKEYVIDGKKRTANYFVLKDPDIATELFAAIKTKFVLGAPKTTKKADKK